MNDFGSVPSTKVEQLIAKIRRDKKLPEDATVSIPFSVLIISCFPGLWKNFEEVLKKEHEKGFIEGYNYRDDNGGKE